MSTHVAADDFKVESFNHLLEGRHVLALEKMLAHLTVQPKDIDGWISAARLQQRLGRHDEADAIADSVDAMTKRPQDTLWLRQLNDFLRQFPAEAAYNLCGEMESRPNYINLLQLKTKIQDALTRKVGFSFIRLGDGEGAFIKISDEDEDKYSELYRFTRKNRSDVWFGGTIDIENSGFNRLALEIHFAIDRADVVGVPPLHWLQYDYTICSATGMPSLVNVLRYFNLKSNTETQSYIHHASHIELYREGYLGEILREQSQVGLISCHAQAPDVLKRVFGFDDVEFYKTPGEKQNVHLLGELATEGQHYPDRFHHIMTALRRPLQGKLFLVAAGLLGKFYCDQIKLSGGIAIDIGSLIDGWMGIDTRPGVGFDRDKLE
ncbi:hypothetical protein [uncultured Methylobacterium sp.]|uniref:GT-D fold domain-containing protein n=1 Tax=uncultured Methylobacterium sp. TaxID=157278 RepID=UPI0025974E41|nr:hypothetical protein [uncultured Methylobacterium sp.]